MLDFLRTYRGIYLLATAAVLLVQIPLTLPEAFRCLQLVAYAKRGAGVDDRRGGASDEGAVTLLRG